MSCSPLLQTERLATALLEGLRFELFLTPKPGLVDLLDSGSHPDLTLAKMLVSIDLIDRYFADLIAALAAGASVAEMVSIGRFVEERMFARLGTNTHKGAIFLCGLLLVARFRATSDGLPLRFAVASTAAEALRVSPPPDASNGESARKAHRVGGIVAEALAGLPSLFETALPAYRNSLCRGEGAQWASFFMLSRLMQRVEDTTALHRCGRLGVENLQRDGRLLEEVLSKHLDPVPLLTALNVKYRAMNLTMGGVADLLGVAFGCLANEGYPLTRGLCSVGDGVDIGRRYGPIGSSV